MLLFGHTRGPFRTAFGVRSSCFLVKNCRAAAFTYYSKYVLALNTLGFYTRYIEINTKSGCITLSFSYAIGTGPDGP
jgi:Na+/melibiose symporter-like transporter